MAKFSQRHGYSPLINAFQRECADEELRTKLWNILKMSIWDNYRPNSYGYQETSEKIIFLVKRLWFNFLNRDMDTLPAFYSDYGRPSAYTLLKEFFFSCAWYEVYDLVEQVALDQSDIMTDETRDWINQELESHNSAYRFVEKRILEVTDRTEIAGIEDGLSDANALARAHLATALRMLSDRTAPDYRNSIKESISAVEATCRHVTGLSSATLGDALKKISNMHPAYKGAFTKLYGYTSDASGIRHSLVDESTISYADAKFMLVACAAFVSYINISTTHP